MLLKVFISLGCNHPAGLNTWKFVANPSSVKNIQWDYISLLRRTNVTEVLPLLTTILNTELNYFLGTNIYHEYSGLPSMVFKPGTSGVQECTPAEIGFTLLVTHNCTLR